jgi:hypothetical protein
MSQAGIFTLKRPSTKWAESSLCFLCALCVSVVFFLTIVDHRDTESTEEAQRRNSERCTMEFWNLVKRKKIDSGIAVISDSEF